MSLSVIKNTINFVKQQLKGAEAGHDWWHIQRVHKNALRILENENGADKTVVELGALLHDIADAKFHEGDENKGPEMARDFLLQQGINEETIQSTEFIIRHISFKGGSNHGIKKSKELMIVQDADRLDALGAIGIARAFNYGGFKNRIFYDPAIPPTNYPDARAYHNSNAPTINHFYEKLLLLKDRMNTKTGKRLAQERHRFLQIFLDQFFAEWEGVK
jgi:uncharacterized protein